jgi:hypothetical protein
MAAREKRRKRPEAAARCAAKAASFKPNPERRTEFEI